MGPRLEGHPQVLVAFHPAAPVDLQLRTPGNALQYPVVDDAAAPGPIEIDHMQPLQSCGLKLTGHGQWVFVVYGLTGVVALGQAHALSVDQVYGGDDVQGGKGLGG